MRAKLLLMPVLLVGAACSSAPRVRPAPDVVVVGRSRASAPPTTVGPRSVGHIPPGHYPPPGQCRVWYQGRPPGQQPAPVRCEQLMHRVPRGAFVLYNAKAWDSQYDWARHEKQHPGSVPAVVLQIVASIGR